MHGTVLIGVTFLFLSVTWACGKGPVDPAKDEGPSGPSRGLNIHEKNPDYEKNEILVKFKKGTDKDTIKSIQRELHLKAVKIVSGHCLYLMAIQDGTSVEKMMKRLEEFNAVSYSEPNYRIKGHE